MIVTFNLVRSSSAVAVGVEANERSGAADDGEPNADVLLTLPTEHQGVGLSFALVDNLGLLLGGGRVDVVRVDYEGKEGDGRGSEGTRERWSDVVARERWSDEVSEGRKCQGSESQDIHLVSVSITLTRRHSSPSRRTVPMAH
jgi:hypothetical protein